MIKKSTVTEGFSSPIEAVWDIVTDNSNYAWRSDISEISVADDGKSFTEFAKNGFETRFNITVKELLERYEFDIENQNIRGHWIGIFFKDGSGTRVSFTEEVEVAKPIMNLFVKAYLKKQQAAYIADLRKALGEQID